VASVQAGQQDPVLPDSGIAQDGTSQVSPSPTPGCPADPWPIMINVSNSLQAAQQTPVPPDCDGAQGGTSQALSYPTQEWSAVVAK
jgi:hypothetical protein